MLHGRGAREWGFLPRSARGGTVVRTDATAFPIEPRKKACVVRDANMGHHLAGTVATGVQYWNLGPHRGHEVPERLDQQHRDPRVEGEHQPWSKPGPEPEHPAVGLAPKR